MIVAVAVDIVISGMKSFWIQVSLKNTGEIDRYSEFTAKHEKTWAVRLN